MFSFLLILIGLILVLQSYGIIGAITGLGWGIIFIVAGLLIFIARVSRRNRRREWMAEYRHMHADRRNRHSHYHDDLETDAKSQS